MHFEQEQNFVAEIKLYVTENLPLNSIEDDESIITDNSNNNIIYEDSDDEFQNADDLEDELLDLTPKYNEDTENNDNK